MQQTLIVGVDVSKSTLDICFKPSGNLLKISNEILGFKKFTSAIKKELIPGNSVLVIMEHTGQYSYRFERFLRSREIEYCKIAALQIKRSLGVTRGKDDRADATRIAEYGWLRRDLLKADLHGEDDIFRLRSLLNLRQKLVRDRASYLVRSKEMIAAGTCKSTALEAKIQQRIIKFLGVQIHETEVQIQALINSNTKLARTCTLLRSIKGVGLIIAAFMICLTENFQKFSNARKFNCYAGLAPFKYESGSSIRGRARVSHLANKEAKSLLNMAASCAIRCNKELKEYFNRRVDEGKRKMSCLNIVRSKIVGRMFAVVKRQSEYMEIRLVA